MLALGIIYDSLFRRKHLSTSNISKLSAGLIIGWLAIGLMALPVRWENGIIFDTRTILLGLTGLFFGPIPTGIAMTIASAYRLFIGGNGTLMGVATIVSSGLIGLAWRHYRFDQALEFSLKELYLFGFAIHSTMILLMFLLPDEYIWITINSIALPVIIIYPVATSFLGILLAHRNQRLIIEEGLQESELRHRQIFQLSPDSIIIHDLDMNIIDANNKAVAEFGYLKEELLTMTVTELHPPSEFQHSEQVLTEIKTSDELTIETKFMRKNKSVFDAEATPCKYQLNDQPIIHVVIRDITERKQAEEELRTSEKLTRSITETAADAIISIDSEAIILSWNKAAQQIFGYTSSEMIKSNLNRIIPEQHQNNHQNGLKRLKSGGKAKLLGKTVEIQGLRKDGTEFPIELSLSSWTSEKQKHYTGIIRDISERKQVESALIESEANYRNIVHDQTEYIMRYLPDGTRIFVNDSYCKTFNVSRKEVLGTNFLERVSESARIRLKKKIAALTPENSVMSDEHESKSIDGNKIWRLWVDRGIFDENGVLKEIQATGRDITKRKLAEDARELALQEATAANEVKDQFVANISHEVRTPLNSILGFSDLLKQRYSDIISEKDRGIFGYITAAGDRLMRTVDSILNLSMMKAGTINIQKQELDLGSIITQAVEQLKLRAQDKNLDLNFTLPKKPQIISADEYCIHQSILNLTENAIKYTIKGTVEIKLGHRDDRVTLSVIDTGIGISAEYQKRLFDAYTQESEGFTKSYQGIGLGLALTKQYLDLNDVEIELVSQKNIGTTFTLTFPKYEGRS